MTIVVMMNTLSKWRRSKPVLFWVSASAALSLMLNGPLTAFVHWYAVSPIGHGGEVVLLFFIFAVFNLLADALLAVPGCMVAHLFKEARKTALVIMLASFVYLVVGWPTLGAGLRAGRAFRMAGFERQAERGSMLVLVIKEFEEKHDRPPFTLDELVPDFLPATPSTGMPGYPNWRYVAGEEAEKWANNPWVLYMDCSSGGLNWDMFLYFPKQNYPERGYGGWLERVGDWAYVHE